MSKFIQNLAKYQSNWIIIKEQKQALNDLLNDFQWDDLSNFLSSIKTWDLEKDSIQVSNILAILLNEEGFQKKLDTNQKASVVDEIYKEFCEIPKDYSKYKDLRRWVRLLLIDYKNSLKLKQAQLLFKNKSIREERASDFMDFFRTKDSRSYFNEALLAELLFPKKDGTHVFYHISPESLKYIFYRKISINKLLKVFKSNISLAIDLLEQRSGVYSVDYGREFLKWVKSLDWEELSKMKTIFLWILAFDYDNGNDYESKYQQKDLLQSELFHKLGAYLVKKDKDFFWRIFSLYDNNKRYIYDESEDFFIYSISPMHVEKFLNSSKIPDWMIVNLYYKINSSKRSTREKEQILKKFIEFKWKLIEANEIAVEKNKEMQLQRIQTENAKVRSEITELINTVTSNNTLMSEKLLWYYENNPSLFLEEEKEIVKSQVHKILTSPTTYNPLLSNVLIDKDNPSSYTWTQYMGNNTIPRCVKIGLWLGMDITEYQSRLVDHLPFAFDDPTIDKVLQPLSLDQVKSLITVYKKWERKDDLRLLHPYKLVSLYKQWLLSQALNKRTKKWEKLLSEFIKVLQELVSENHPRINNYAKKGFIRVLWDFAGKGVSEQYFIGQFKYYNDPKLNYFNDILSNEPRYWTVSDFELWAECNLILIEKYKNTEAIDRRIKQLLWITVELAEPIPGFWHSITKIMSELGIWNKEKFYDPILKSIKYPEFENEIVKVLEHSFILKQESNLSVSYLQGFVASYYRGTIDPKEAVIWLINKVQESDQFQNFLHRYLYRHLDRSLEQVEIFELKNENQKLKNTVATKPDIKTPNKTEYKVDDLIKENSKLEYEVLNKVKELEDLKQSYDELAKQVLEYQKDDIIILTEGKTDWRHLCRAAEELLSIEIEQKKRVVYESFLKYIKRIYFDLWGKLSEFAQNLAKLYKEKTIIAIVDSADEEVIKLDWTLQKNYDNAFYEGIYKYKVQNTSIENLRYIALPHPDEAAKEYYKEKWCCIELYYDKNDLKEKFIVPRDIDSIKYNNGMFSFYYGGKKIIWKVDKDKKLKVIYDSSQKNNIFFDENLNSFQLTTSKNEFSQQVFPSKDWETPMIMTDPHTRKRFDRIFDLFQKIIDFRVNL